LKTLSLFLDRLSNWKILLVVIAVYISFPAYFLKNAETKINALSGKTIGPIDLTMGFAPQKTLQMVAEYSDEARAYYTTVETTLDIVYPIVYTLLLGIILSLLYRNKPYKPFGCVNLLPFISLVADYLENTTIVMMLNSYPKQSIVVATLCEIFKLVKWLSFAATILLIIYGLIRRLPETKPI